MNQNLNFISSNDLNISNSSEKDLNDVLSDDLLSYSEDKSQTLIQINQNNENNEKININSKFENNQNIYKNENLVCSNNSEITLSFLSNKNKSGNQRQNLKRNESKKSRKIINELKEGNYNGSNKDLSSLQISLSNLLSDIDSKDICFTQNIKLNGNSNNDSNKIKNNFENELIDISDNSNLKNNNINLKDKTNTIEEYSSSLCNYSQSLHMNNNSLNNNSKNKENNYMKTIGTNYNKSKISKNVLRYIKPKKNNNNDKKTIKEKINNKLPFNLNKKKKNNFRINNNVINNPKFNYQIEKGENIQLSINKVDNSLQKVTYPGNYIYNNYNNNSQIKSFFSINKTQNFTINSSTFDYNYSTSEYYDKLKKENITSLEIIKEILKNNKIIEKIDNQNYYKNKIKLINNKNIEIMKEDSKKFFYNPKKKTNLNHNFYINANNYLINNKTENYIDNKSNSINTKRTIFITERNIKKEKNLILNNYINRKNTKKLEINTNYFTNENLNKNSKKIKSFNKNIFGKNSKILQKIYNKKKRKTISDLDNFNNSNNKNSLKIKFKTRNISIDGIYSKKNNTLNHYNKQNAINRNNGSITDKALKTKKNDIIKKSNYFNFLNKIKTEQKKTKKKLLNQFSKLNNININIINKGILFPSFPKAFPDSTKYKTLSENNSKKIKEHKEKLDSKSKITKKIKINKIIKVNKNNYLSDNIKKKKENKNNIKNNQHKKINTQINLTSLLNNFNKNARTNNKSLFNFGNIYFINQNHSLKKKESNLISSNNYENEFNIQNDNYDNSKLNTINYSIIKQKPQIINDFSNYKKKPSYSNNIINELNEKNTIRNIGNEFKKNKSDIYDNFKNNFNIRIKIRDSFKIKKVEGDSGNDIIKGI